MTPDKSDTDFLATEVAITQTAIQALLECLEHRTGCLVDSVTLSTSDVTTIADARRVLGRSVEVRLLNPQPVVRWVDPVARSAPAAFDEAVFAEFRRRTVAAGIGRAAAP